MRDYWMRDPRMEMARVMESLYMDELAKYGRIDDLNLTAQDVIEGAKIYLGVSADNLPHPPHVAEAAFVCSKIDEAIARMNWEDE